MCLTCPVAAPDASVRRGDVSVFCIDSGVYRGHVGRVWPSFLKGSRGCARGASIHPRFASVCPGTRYSDKVEAAVKAALKRKGAGRAARMHRRGCHVGLAPAPALHPPHRQSLWLIRVRHTYARSGRPVFDETSALTGIRGRGRIMGRR